MKRQRKVTMFKENWRSARKIVSLIPTLKSSLVVAGCWLASLLAQVNVAEPMGMLNCIYVSEFVFDLDR